MEGYTLQEHSFRILVINPGSTSTKIGVFDNERSILEKTIRHDTEALRAYKKIIDQYEFRKQTILETLDHEGINISKLDAVCGRGGLLRPIEGGTYAVNEAMLQDLKRGYSGARFESRWNFSARNCFSIKHSSVYRRSSRCR